MVNIDIDIIELSEGFIPHYKYPTDACADCRAHIRDKVVIAPRGMITIPLGFKIDIPVGYEGHICSRSGLARKSGITVVDGHVDPGFIGEVTATLINHLDVPFEIERGDRICQLQVKESPKITFHEVEALPESERGENGWGSSGIK